MFNEGVDIPDANLLVFLRSSGNPNIFQQQLGRGLRLIPGKDTVRVLDFVANSEHIRAIHEFATQITDIVRDKHGAGSEGIGAEDIFNLSNNVFEFEEVARRIETILSKIQVFDNSVTDDQIVAIAKKISPDSRLSSEKIRKLSKEGSFPSLSTIFSRFGSMGEFHKRCGYKVIDNASLSDAELIALAAELSGGRRISLKDIRAWSADEKFVGETTIFKRFGTIAGLNEACGLKVKKKKWKPDEIITLAKRIKRDGALSYKEIQELSSQDNFPGFNIIRKHFSTIREFQKACGFEVKELASLSNDELVALALEISPEGPLSRRQIDTLSSKGLFIGSKTIRRKFGSQAKFQKQCGFEGIPAPVMTTPEQILEQVLGILRDDPDIRWDSSTCYQLSKEGRLVSPPTIRKSFGTLENFRQRIAAEVERQRQQANSLAGGLEQRAETIEIFTGEEMLADEEITPEVVLLDQSDVRKLWDRLPRMRTSKKVDHNEKREANIEIGERGEKIVMDIEKKRLIDAGRPDLAEKIWQASLVDDSLGFDILSFEADGHKRHIEVKATRNPRSNRLKFFVSENERRASEFFDNYHIYFVDDAESSTPRVTQIKCPLNEENFSISPINYVIEGLRQ